MRVDDADDAAEMSDFLDRLEESTGKMADLNTQLRNASERRRRSPA